MARIKRLGRGLESLLSHSQPEEGLAELEGGPSEQVPVDRIRPNPFQPRRDMAPEKVAELAASIREHGLLQPLLVRHAPEGDGFELIAGERRWRACREAGLESVPVVMVEADDDQALAMALVENLQREDLNPIEKGMAFHEMSERFGLTQEEIAARMGKDRSTVANFMRLLDLPETVRDLVSRGTLNMGHARALLGLKSAQEQVEMCKRVVREDMSVRSVESAVAASKVGKDAPKSPREAKRSPYLRDLEDRLRDKLGLKVVLDGKGGRGRMVIHFANDGELQAILEALGVASEE